MHHCWYDDNALLDLRFLLAAEPYDGGEEAAGDGPYGIGCLMEIGSTPQRILFEYPTQRQRDIAFERLIAQHQAWMASVHTCDEEED